MWPTYNNGDNPEIWDPATGNFIAVPKVGYNIFCSGHTHLADGRVFVAGGQVGAVLYGVANASIYDPTSNTWASLPPMYAPRWYPTATSLSNGDVLVLSGQADPARGFVALPEVWQNGLHAWKDLTSAQLILPLYPRTFLAPNGKVFYAGEAPISRYLDTEIGNWTTLAKTNFPGTRDYGSAVQYGDGKILIVGGGPPTASAEVIDLTSAAPVWRSVASMANARRQFNATLLPNGQVLVTGGSSGPGFSDTASPVLAAEVWNPTSESWTTLASQTGYRGYHSIALLLPDATVLIAGGDPNLSTAQVFSPPYLFNGPRPTISSAPTSVNYGDTFQVSSPEASSVTEVTWLRLGSVTHAFNADQRFTRLQFTQATSPPGLNVSAPTNPNLCPPGYYMMFILDGAKVPSVAAIVQLLPANTPPPPVSLAPSSIMLPQTVLNTTSSTKTVLLTNNQTSTLTLNAIQAAGDFSEADDCPPSLSAGGSCTITISFLPTALGNRTGSIAITDSASNSPQVVNLAGTGVTAASMSPTTLWFGKQAVGTISSARSTYLFNNQTVPLTISSIGVTGDYSQTNTCVSPMAPNTYCNIWVKFRPTTSGSRPGLLTVVDSANNSPQTVNLTGSGN